MSDREYTKLEYTSPIESVPEPDEMLGTQVETITFASKVVLFGCPDCGSIVWDQRVHDKWHARR